MAAYWCYIKETADLRDMKGFDLPATRLSSVSSLDTPYLTVATQNMKYTNIRQTNSRQMIFKCRTQGKVKLQMFCISSFVTHFYHWLLWPQNNPFGPFQPIQRSSSPPFIGASRWPLLISEIVPMHRPGCALTCCKLVPNCSISFDQPAAQLEILAFLDPFGP